MDSGIDPEELANLTEMGRPQPGDDEAMVVTRTLLRAVVRLSKAVAANKASIEKAAVQTSTCAETATIVKRLADELTPANDADGHISVRVRRLERTGSGILAVLKANSGAIFLALALGAYFLINKATH